MNVAQEHVSHSVGPAAARVSVPITTPAGCAWTVTSTVPFLTVSTTSGTGPGILEIDVAENTGARRSGAIQAGTATLSIDQAEAQGPPSPACSYAVSPRTLSMAAAGGTVELDVQVTAGTDCRWTTAAEGSFVTVGGPSTRAGSDRVPVTVERNTGEGRSATLTIAGLAVRVEQAAPSADPPAPDPAPGPAPVPPAPGPAPLPPAPAPGPSGACTFTVSPASFAVPAAGGEFTVAVSVSRADCTWAVLPGATFVITQGPVERSGSGFATITVQRNTGAARVGTASVAGQTVTLLQEAVGAEACVFDISPRSTTLPVGGGTVTLTVSVTQGSNCAWSTRVLGDAISIVSGHQGTGPGTVVVSVGPNPGVRRWSSITIGGERAEVFQPENPGGCVHVLSPSTASITWRAQTVTFDVVLTTGSFTYCNFTLNSWRDDPMLTPESMTQIGNSMRIVLAITENPSTVPRNSLVTIVGIDNPLRFTVFQAGRQ